MTNKLNIYDLSGAAAGEIVLEDKYIELEKGTQAVHDTVVAFMAGERSGTASTLTRAEVRGGGRKPWRQKGLGRARCGSTRSPIWVKGGVTFGPKPRSYDKKINKKVRKLALKRAFSERVQEGVVKIADKIELPDHKSKNIRAFLKNLKVSQNTLIIVDDYDENVLRAASNFPECLLIRAATVNVYNMLLHKDVVITKKALDILLERFV